ncbi:MAG: aminomethyltransferase family protein [Actinomycetota bacterium]
MADEHKSPLHAIQESMGATFVPEGGWLWTESFGDTDAEYRAPRENVGMWDLAPLNKWEFTGKDATTAIQRIHSNDIAGMSVGQVKYGAFLDIDGLMVDDGTVYKFAGDHYWVMTNGMERREYFAGNTQGLDVNIEYRSFELPNLQVQGPRSRDFLAVLTDADLSSLKYFTFLPEQVKVGGVPVTLSRTGFSGELGFELFVAAENAEDLWKAVHGAGAQPYGVGVIEPIRIETGMIVTDYDYEQNTRTPFDFNMDRLVATGKADAAFNGKAKLSEIAKNPPNRFKTVKWDGDLTPEYGSKLTSGGAEVGVLTSPCQSPTFGGIGLAILASDVASDGEKVEIAHESGAIPGTVDVLAIYDPNKTRPRS